jgi:membrane protease YdiL (CAAX protease family)
MWAIAVVVGVLSLRNLAGERLIPPEWYVPVNLAVAGFLVLAAWRSGLSAADLGLARARMPAGLGVGAVVAVATAGVIVAGAAMPWTRSLFEDQRLAAVDGLGELAYQALVRVPLGTVVLEEVAFRGVLLALVAKRWSTGVAVVVSSVLFGLWHVHPTLDGLAANDLATGLPSRMATVAAAVVLTGVAGALLCGLRLATDSLAAPVVVHATMNSVATLAAYIVLQSS